MLVFNWFMQLELMRILVVFSPGVTHTRNQEANQVMDILSIFGLSSDTDVHVFEFIPAFLCNAVTADAAYILFPHGY